MEIIFHLFSSAYTLIFVINLIFILVVLFSRKSPAKIFSWLLVLYFMPLFGFILYLFLGIDWRKRSIIHRLNQSDRAVLAGLEEKTQEALQARPEARRMKALMTMASVTTRLPACSNNNVYVSHDPTEAFERMRSDMLQARHHIHLEFYIIQPDSTGAEFLKILLKMADEQVNIKLIVDAVGSKRSIHRRFFDKLRMHPNVSIVVFQPFKFPFVNIKANYRNHRKIMVIDGVVGYLGGMNIGDEYLGKTKQFGYWRDTMIRLEGQAVQNIQTVFLQDWHFVKKEKLPRSKEYFPDFSQRLFGNQLVQMVTSSPHANWDTIAQLYFTSITSARSTLYITTPYFIPDEALMRALKAAVLGGVEVIILVPGKPDRRLQLSFLATSAYLEEAVLAGIRVYQYDRERFIHSKVITVDGIFASIGSANVDQRSMNINFEMNALIYDRKIVADINEAFFRDLEHSRQLTREGVRAKSSGTVIAEALVRLLSPIL